MQCTLSGEKEIQGERGTRGFLSRKERIQKELNVFTKALFADQ